MLLYLLLRQPFEVLVTESVVREVCLAGQNTTFHEEGLGAAGRYSVFEDGLDDVVADGDVANNPGIHVDACALDKDSLCCLWEMLVKLNL